MQFIQINDKEMVNLGVVQIIKDDEKTVRFDCGEYIKVCDSEKEPEWFKSVKSVLPIITINRGK